MASWQISDAGDFLKDLDKLDNTETIIPKMLEESATIVEARMKSALQTHKQTGAMVNSVKPSGVKEAKGGGHYVVVSPTGSSRKQIDKNGKERSRKKAERNMEKLAILEYGSSKQRATPIIGNVVASVQNEVTNKMEEVYFREAGIK